MGGPGPTHPSNPKGQFEDNDFVEIFSKAIGNWRAPATQFVPVNVVEDTQALVDNRSAEYEVWGLKTPQLCITLRWVIDLYIPDLHIILIKRPFDDCVSSMMRRDNAPRSVAEYIQSLYYCNLQEGLAVAESAKVPILEVEYEDLLDDPAEEVIEISEFINHGFSIKTLEDAVSSIDSSLNHA